MQGLVFERWTLHYDPSAFKELAKLDKGIQLKIKDYLAEVCLLDDPAARGHGLAGREGDCEGWRPLILR